MKKPVSNQHYQDVSHRLRVSAVFLLRSDGAVLFQHRDDKPGIPKPGMWVVPGGHQEENETSLACAVREFEEETAYHCENLRFLACLVDYNEITGSDYDLNIYWTYYDGLQNLTCREGQGLKFIHREESASYRIPALLLKTWDQVREATEKNQGL